MSAPGFWKSIDGRNIPITEMEAGHLKNSLYYTYRKIVEMETNATNRGILISRDTPGYQQHVPKYYTDKIRELGEEVVRRNLETLNLASYSTLMTSVQPHNDAVMARRAASTARWAPPPVPAYPSSQAPASLRPVIRVAELREASPPAVLSVYVDVLQASDRLLHNAAVIKRRPVVKLERNLSFDL